MTVLTGYPPRRPAGRGPLVATIGVFDGVHRGHRSVLGVALRRARARGGRAVVVTFDRHPLATLAPATAPRAIMTLAQRLEAIAALGYGSTIVLPFTRRVANRPAEAFVREVLGARLRLAELVVGYDFRFGRGGTGDASLLKEMGPALGFAVRVVPPVLDGGSPVSSTRIRRLLTAGRVEEAGRLLGRPPVLVGSRRPGRRLARRLGFPTINLAPLNELLPPFGVYAVRYGPDRRPGVANLGVRPTVTPRTLAPLLEVHSLVPPPPVPIRSLLTVELAAFLRPELKFPGLAPMVRQIRRDVAAARDRLGLPSRRPA